MHNVEQVLVFVGHEIPINPIIKIAENFDIEKLLSKDKKQLKEAKKVGVKKTKFFCFF